MINLDDFIDAANYRINNADLETNQRAKRDELMMAQGILNFALYLSHRGNFQDATADQRNRFVETETRLVLAFGHMAGAA